MRDPTTVENLALVGQNQTPSGAVELTYALGEGRTLRQLRLVDGTIFEEAFLLGTMRDGPSRRWSEKGGLLSMEPYVNGRLNGVVWQFATTGEAIGCYEIFDGTGWTFWWHEAPWYLSEATHLREMRPTGNSWWFAPDARPILERRFADGVEHGVTRAWADAKLSEKTWYVAGQRVEPTIYRQAAEQFLVPCDNEGDDLPFRILPDEVKTAMDHATVVARCTRLGPPITS